MFVKVRLNERRRNARFPVKQRCLYGLPTSRDQSKFVFTNASGLASLSQILFFILFVSYLTLIECHSDFFGVMF